MNKTSHCLNFTHVGKGFYVKPTSLPIWRDLAIRELIKRHGEGPDTLWITRCDGSIWWYLGGASNEYSAQSVVPTHGWNDISARGTPIEMERVTQTVDSTLTKIEQIGEIPEVELKYYLRILSGESHPICAKAYEQIRELRKTLVQLIEQLSFQDFNDLVRRIFTFNFGEVRTKVIQDNSESELWSLYSPMKTQTVRGRVSFRQLSSTREEIVKYEEIFEDNAMRTQDFYVENRHIDKEIIDAHPNIQILGSHELARETMNANLVEYSLRILNRGY